MGVDGRVVKRKLNIFTSSTTPRVFDIQNYDEEHLLLVTSSGYCSCIAHSSVRIMTNKNYLLTEIPHIALTNNSQNRYAILNVKTEVRSKLHQKNSHISFLPAQPNVCIYNQDKNSIVSVWTQHREYQELRNSQIFDHQKKN